LNRFFRKEEEEEAFRVAGIRSGNEESEAIVLVNFATTTLI